MYHYRGMRNARRLFVVLGIVGAVTDVVSADPKPGAPPLVHAIEVVKLSPPAGFIDDAVGGDDTKLAYVVSDGATRSELHVVTVDGSRPEVVVDLSAVTLHPIDLPFVSADNVFVIADDEGGGQTGALVQLGAHDKKPAGTAQYRLGPAAHIQLITYDGKRCVALHRTTAGKDGTRHAVELYNLTSGKRIAAGKPIELDAKGTDKSLELTVNHWANGMTQAIGIKGGEWDKKEDQRSPNTEATYDLITNRFTERKPITDLFEQHKRFQTLADVHGDTSFVRMTWDNTAIQVWRDGRPKQIELDQPLTNYDPKSLQGILSAVSGGRIALAVDPVNPDAVARKKADPAYFDIFDLDAAETKATLRSRVLAPKSGFRFGTLGKRYWLLERSPSSERGGKSLAVYDIGDKS
jgi:hypothetical protein